MRGAEAAEPGCTGCPAGGAGRGAAPCLRAGAVPCAQRTRVAWSCRTFAELDAPRLHAMLRLRQQIFVVEQDVAYADIDGRDPLCRHVVGESGGGVVACLRLLPLGLFAPGCVSLGRVVVAAQHRRSGLGTELVRRGLAQLDRVREGAPVRISSQLYLADFYATLGFVAHGEPYIEDRIPHLAMVRT